MLLSHYLELSGRLARMNPNPLVKLYIRLVQCIGVYRSASLNENHRLARNSRENQSLGINLVFVPVDRRGETFDSRETFLRRRSVIQDPRSREVRASYARERLVRAQRPCDRCGKLFRIPYFLPYLILYF